MPYIQVYIHLVWTTKERFPFLHSLEVREKVWKHIKENALSKSIYLDFVGGHMDHCHALLSLGNDKSLSEIMQLIKGESAYWINRHKLTKEKFAWQDEYFAGGVAYDRIDIVRNYIRNQEEHHKKRTFHDEYEDFLNRNGFELLKDGQVINRS